MYDGTNKFLRRKNKMNNTNSESNSTKKVKSYSKDATPKLSEKELQKNAKKTSKADLKTSKKSEPIKIVNKEVLRESRKMEQGYSTKKDDKVADIVENKNVAAERSTVVDKKDIPPESAANFEEKVSERTDSPVITNETQNETCKITEENSKAEPEEKKERRPVLIELKDKSDTFKKIIDIALAYERLENERKKLKATIKIQGDKNAELEEERDCLKRNLEATELLCQKKQLDIERLQADIEHRNEVINIVKADKDESSQEFKNALAASLRICMQDFKELKELEMSDDVGYAAIDTLENVFKILGKNGISI